MKKLSPIPLALVAALGVVGVVLAPPLLGWRSAPEGAMPGTPTAQGGGGVQAEDPDQLPDDQSPPLVPVCKIQGSGFSSPKEGQQVRTQGVVYADLDQTGWKGFFILEPGCDGNPATSDGLFIHLGFAQDVVELGDRVEVAGLVQEYFGLTQVLTSPGAVTPLASGQVLPSPEELSPPFDNNSARVYYESREGMHVILTDGRVVGPTSHFDETRLVRSDLGITRVFQDDPAGTGEIITVDGDGLAQIEPVASVGDRVTGLAGPLSYSLGDYRLHLMEAPVVSPAVAAEAIPPGLLPDYGAGAALSGFLSFEVATFNVKNLFDTIDDPATEDPVPSAASYQRHLEKLEWAIAEGMAAPLLIGLQEVENEAVLSDLVSRPELQGLYGYLHLDGPDARGIDVAVLYRTDRTLPLEYRQVQGCTALVDALGPDGNLDVQNPHNDVTCDLDGDGILDGNRLFSRPPLVLEIQMCAARCLGFPGGPQSPSIRLWVVVVHLKSKTQDTEWTQYTLPRRLEQAAFLVSLLDEIELENPGANAIILGDVNDYPNSSTLSLLSGAGLEGLAARLPPSERYTYIYRGVSQVLDHVLVNTALLDERLEPRVVHINVDFPEVLGDVNSSPYRSSDHDPLVVNFAVMPEKVYLPMALRTGAGI